MRKTILFVVALFCFSCSGKKETRLYVIFDRISGLTEHSPVFINGVKSGEVESVSLTSQYKPLLTVKLNKDIKVPIHSEFSIGAPDLITQALMITPSAEKSFYHDGDTVNGVPNKSLREAIKEIPDSVKVIGRKTLNLLKEGLRVLTATIEQAKQPHDTTMQKAIDLVARLPIVKKEMQMVEKHSGGKRHLQFMVLTNSETYYLYDVLVAEDNGTNLVNHFAFVVDLDKNKVLNPDGKEIKPSEISPSFSKIKDVDSTRLKGLLDPNRYKHNSIFGKRKAKK